MCFVCVCYVNPIDAIHPPGDGRNVSSVQINSTCLICSKVRQTNTHTDIERHTHRERKQATHLQYCIIQHTFNFSQNYPLKQIEFIENCWIMSMLYTDSCIEYNEYEHLNILFDVSWVKRLKLDLITLLSLAQWFFYSVHQILQLSKASSNISTLLE